MIKIWLREPILPVSFVGEIEVRYVGTIIEDTPMTKPVKKRIVERILISREKVETTARKMRQASQSFNSLF